MKTKFGFQNEFKDKVSPYYLCSSTVEVIKHFMCVRKHLCDIGITIT